MDFSPDYSCDNQHSRATYVDRLIYRDRIKFILDLADSDEIINDYISQPDFDCPYFLSLYNDRNVLPVELNANYSSDEYHKKLVDGLTIMSQHDGPYLIHCTEGKDRTGFVCMVLEALAGASWDEIESDYMMTYSNYYGITKESNPDRYNLIVENLLIPMVEEITGGENQNIEITDLMPYAKRFLMDAGMSDKEILALLEKLQY